MWLDQWKVDPFTYPIKHRYEIKYREITISVVLSSNGAMRFDGGVKFSTVPVYC